MPFKSNDSTTSDWGNINKGVSLFSAGGICAFDGDDDDRGEEDDGGKLVQSSVKLNGIGVAGLNKMSNSSLYAAFSVVFLRARN